MLFILSKMRRGAFDMEDFEKEKIYLRETLTYIKEQIEQKEKLLLGEQESLSKTRKEIWEEGVHFTNDFDKLTELNQSLMSMETHEIKVKAVSRQIEDYKKLLVKPYFARFDFIEHGEEKEKIYIGIKNVIDDDSYNIWVYDWRAPISGIFYQFGLGEVSYRAPKGEIKGEVTLKRQYQIKKGELKYYADCESEISDPILLELLSQNASPKMKNIVSTIQKEQDAVIRDTTSEVIVLQGVAGSGKTSVALHRMAFLLYHGMQQGLTSNNLLILSPNTFFSKYISEVLPELGEENVCQTTFSSIITELLGDQPELENKMDFFERCMLANRESNNLIKKSWCVFKQSKDFKRLLERLTQFYIKKCIPFKDVYYNGQTLITRERLKNELLSSKIKSPVSKRLERIEKRILKEITPLEKRRLKEIEKHISEKGGWEFQEKAISRLLLYKRFQAVNRQIQTFTKIDYLEVYKTLLSDPELFCRLSKDLLIPHDSEKMLAYTKKQLEKGRLTYEDSVALAFIKLSFEEAGLFAEIKHVVIDEAQDYSELEYEIIKRVFKEVRLTIVGDENQVIEEKEPGQSWYKTVQDIFKQKRCRQLFLNKNYRCAYGISRFAEKLLDTQEFVTHFERKGEEPVCFQKGSLEAINAAIVEEISRYFEKGYESIAVLCRDIKEAQKIESHLASLSSKNSKKSDEKTLVSRKRVKVMPIYLAKGLEFDAVILYNGSKENYFTELDRKLLYIACTRALHQLTLYFTGEISRWIPKGCEGEQDGTV